MVESGLLLTMSAYFVIILGQKNANTTTITPMTITQSAFIRLPAFLLTVKTGYGLLANQVEFLFTTNKQIISQGMDSNRDSQAM
ncbi:hypothetical protein SDC9_174338 [bioreactor metagenome]|uniref:Uncharacterized protein n=1 Tax=bioreactor metagenome TaxID=1076179 RepID=A0A645GM23_9ZZZZ